ncbi:MAG: type II toxin-antitoxin system HicA family toxin [Nitrospirae bacterium]|nr:type II toxin-antitoxin system HicA family toxin [Nitrospirota bacterium]
MKAVSGKILCRLLEEKGWELKRINGSHRIYAKEGSVIRISVPVHGSTLMKIGLQKHLMKLGGIDESKL